MGEGNDLVNSGTGERRDELTENSKIPDPPGRPRWRRSHDNPVPKWEVEARRRMREREALQRLEAAQGESTSSFYRDNKQIIAAKTKLNDTSFGSRVLFEARAGALRILDYQKRFDTKVESTLCQTCGDGAEKEEHLVLTCECLLPRVMNHRHPHPKQP